MNERNLIKLLLVDDHMVVRKGIQLVLEEARDFSICAEAENGEEALLLCKKHRPNIVLMDVRMDGIGGVEATKLIVKHHQSIKVIGLSTYVNQNIVSDMFNAGARGYLLKDVSATDLVQAIRRVHRGEKVAPDEYSLLDVEQTSSLEVSESLPLGEQQKRVLALLTKGLTNPEIAEQVGISISTVRYHVSAILRKLDVSNRSEATSLAIRQSLISETDF